MPLLSLTLLLAAADPPPADAHPHDPPPPGAVAAVGSARFRVGTSRVFLSADGKAAVYAADGAVVTLDPATGRVLDRLPVEASMLVALGYDPKSGRLVAVGHPGPVDQGAALETAAWVIDVPGRKVLRSMTLAADVQRRPWRYAVSADGSRLAVAYMDGGVRSWDLATGEEGGNCTTPPRSPEWLAISPDGKTVVLSGHGLGLVVGDLGSPGESRKLALPAGFEPGEAAFGPDGKALYVVARSAGRTLALDPATGKQTGGFDILTSPQSLAVSPDGKTLAAAYYPNRDKAPEIRAVVLWDIGTGKEVGRLPTGRGFAQWVTWSADGSRVAGLAGRLWVWEVKTGQPVTPPPVGHEGSIHLAVFAGGGRLFTAGTDGTVRSWDPQTGLPGPVLETGGRIGAVAVAADGGLVAGAAGDALKVWDAKTGAVRHALRANSRRVGCSVLGFSPDGKRLVTWGKDLRLRTFDTATGKVLADHPTYPDGEAKWDEDDPRAESGGGLRFRPFALSPDASHFAVHFQGRLRVYDTTSGKERPRLPIGSKAVGKLAFSPDGKRLAVSGYGEYRSAADGGRGVIGDEHPLAVWDLATGQPVWRAKTPGYGAYVLLFTADGKRVVEQAFDPSYATAFQVRDAATGAEVGRLAVTQKVHASGFAIDPAGKRVAVPLRNGTVAVYDLDAAKPPAK